MLASNQQTLASCERSLSHWSTKLLRSILPPLIYRRCVSNCKRFSCPLKELQVEKQKTGRVEAMMREQRGAMEKELGNMQAKAQGSYQDLQAMQIKVKQQCPESPQIGYYRTAPCEGERVSTWSVLGVNLAVCVQFQQVREQLESQISRLQQENGILRDAVSSATNQMENKLVKCWISFLFNINTWLASHSMHHFFLFHWYFSLNLVFILFFISQHLLIFFFFLFLSIDVTWVGSL